MVRRPFFVIFLILLLSTVYSYPIIQDFSDLAGLEVDTPVMEYHKVNTDYTFYASAYNKSNGYLISNTDTDLGCYLNLYSPSKEHVITVVSTNTAGSFVLEEMKVLGGNFSELGEYSVDIVCVIGGAGVGIGDYVNYRFYVTPTGHELTEGTSILYLGWMIIVSLLFLGTLILTVSIDTRDKSNGETFYLNWQKYLKLFLIPMVYLLFMFLIGGMYSIMTNYLLFDNASQVFNFVNTLLWSFLYPLLIMMVLIGFINFINDKKLYKNMERGLLPR